MSKWKLVQTNNKWEGLWCVYMLMNDALFRLWAVYLSLFRTYVYLVPKPISGNINNEQRLEYLR